MSVELYSIRFQVDLSLFITIYAQQHLELHLFAWLRQQESPDVRHIDDLLAQQVVNESESKMLSLQRTVYLGYFDVFVHFYEAVHDLFIVLLLIHKTTLSPILLILFLLLSWFILAQYLHLRLAASPSVAVLFQYFCYKSFH